MSYSNKTILKYSDELTFIQAFIDSLTAEDNRIVCTTTDLAEQFNNAATTPSFQIVIADTAIITFTRSTASGAGTHYYTAVVKKVGETAQLSSANLMINGTGGSGDGKDTVTNRSFKYTVITNDNAVCLMLGGYNITMPSAAQIKTLATKDDNNGDAFSIDFENFRTSENSTKAINRLNYIRDGNDSAHLHIIESKVVIVQDTSTYVTTLKGVYDCSTLTTTNTTIVATNNAVYFGLNAHTLIPVKVAGG